MNPFLHPDHRSPLDPPDNPPPKTKEEREFEAIQEAMQRDRENLNDPKTARLNELEQSVTAMKPVVDELKTLHGSWPLKVVGDNISIDPMVIDAQGRVGGGSIPNCIVVTNGFPFYAELVGSLGAEITV